MKVCAPFLSGPAQRSEAGFVLVAVLWILAALATLASIYSSYTVNSATASHIADDRVQADASIRAGLEMAVYRQLSLPEKARPVRGGFDLHVGRTGVTVQFRSEASRIDLNAASPDLLAGVFVAVGVDPMRAQTFAARVVGWRTQPASGAGQNPTGSVGANGAASQTQTQAGLSNPQPGTDPANGANAAAGANPSNAQAGTDLSNAETGAAAKEDQLYRQQHMPYPPRHAPFDNALELSLLPGISLAVVERVLPFVTVFSGSGQVDVFSADPTVLSALPGMTPKILGEVLNARVKDPGDGKALLELLGPAKTGVSAEKPKAFRTSIAVDFDNGRHVHAEVVFRLKDKGPKEKGDEAQAGTDQKAHGRGGPGGGGEEARGGGGPDTEPYDLLYWRDDFDGPMQSS